MLKTFLKKFWRQMYPKEIDGLDRLFTQYYNDIYQHEDIKVIFDIGSRDALQSVELSERFPNATIYAFECNPGTIPLCHENAKGNSKIKIIEKAVTDYDGEITFYPVNMDKSSKDGGDLAGHHKSIVVGTSSLFRKGTTNHDDGTIITHDEITVPCTRLDTFCKQEGIKEIDIIWMDLEGAELLALKSLGEYIRTIKILQTEATILDENNKTGMAGFINIDKYISGFGFDLLEKKRIQANLQNEGHTDVQYINKAFYLYNK
ncbi:FkbM family methyltransferase [Candidatus Margulisiibacteriota bacterium]